MNEKQSHVARFIAFLQGLSGPSGRAQLARLRRAAADPLGNYEDIQVLGIHLPDDDGWKFDAYRLVATLYALHKQRYSEEAMPAFPAEEKRRSFGASLQRLRQQLDSGKDSLDLRFSALLDTPAENLAVPLRGLVQRCASAKRPVPVDYEQLLKDLIWWEGDYTRRQWAREYWQYRDPDQASDAPATEEAANN